MNLRFIDPINGVRKSVFQAGVTLDNIILADEKAVKDKLDVERNTGTEYKLGVPTWDKLAGDGDVDGLKAKVQEVFKDKQAPITRADSAVAIRDKVWQKVLAYRYDKEKGMGAENQIVRQEKRAVTLEKGQKETIQSFYVLKSKEEFEAGSAQIAAVEELSAQFDMMEGWNRHQMRHASASDTLEQIKVEFAERKDIHSFQGERGASDFADKLVRQSRLEAKEGERPNLVYDADPTTGRGTVRSFEGGRENMRKVAVIAVAKGGTGPFKLFGATKAQIYLAQEMMKYQVIINMDKPGKKVEIPLLGEKTLGTGKFNLTGYEKLYNQVQAHNDRVRGYKASDNPREFVQGEYKKLLGKNDEGRNQFVSSLGLRDMGNLAEDMVKGMTHDDETPDTDQRVANIEKLLLDIGGKKNWTPSWMRSMGKGPEAQAKAVISRVKELGENAAEGSHEKQVYDALKEKYVDDSGQQQPLADIPEHVRSVVRDTIDPPKEGTGAEVQNSDQSVPSQPQGEVEMALLRGR